MTEEFLAQILRLIKKRARRGPSVALRQRGGISLASDYLSGVLSCLDDPRCGADRCPIASREQFERALKEAESRLVYCHQAMRLLGGLGPSGDGDSSQTRKFGSVKKVKELSPGSILDFEGVITTSIKDRDRDVLESSGAVIDPKHALLWQHLPFEPIGKHVEVVQQNRKRVISHFAVADTALGHDAAVLTEFGALRLSHGFIPLEIERLAPEEGEQEWEAGLHVKRFEVVETSLVSVPSNREAEILAFSRGKLHHPYAKAQAIHLRKQKPAQVTSGWADGEHGKKCSCGDLCAECRSRVTAEDVAAAEDFDLNKDAGRKPYAQEHACRVEPPEDFDKFRRQNKKKGDKAYGLIFGHVKGGQDDEWKVQSIRFPKEDWSAAEASAACKKAEGTFEQASSDDEDKSLTWTPPPPNWAKWGRGKSWNGIALDGSAEWIEDQLEDQLEDYLEGEGDVELDKDDCAHLVGVFSDHVIIAVVSGEEDSDEGEDVEAEFYAISWSMSGGEPTLTGAARPVQLTVTEQAAGEGEEAKAAISRLIRRKRARSSRQAMSAPSGADTTACKLIEGLRRGDVPGPGTLLALQEEFQRVLDRQWEAELLGLG